MSGSVTRTRNVRRAEHGDDGSCNRPQPSSRPVCSLGEETVKGRWLVARSAQAFIGWIWAGALMMRAGGLAAAATSDIARHWPPLTATACVDCNPNGGTA